MRLVIVMMLTAQSATVFGASVPADAAAIAARDIVTLDLTTQLNTFYTWDPWNSRECAGATNYAINAALSKTSVLIQGVPIGGGVMRWDQRLLTPGNDDYWTLFRLLENLSLVDPYFHAGEPLRLDCPGNHKFWQDGQWWTARSKTRQFAHHTGLQNMLLVHSLTGRFMPIMRADWFNILILSTLDVGGTRGIYYEAKGFRGKNLDAILRLYGSTAATFANLDKQARLAMKNSGIAKAGVRRIDFAYGNATRPTEGPTLIVVTQDVALGDTDVGQSAWLNLLQFKATASEIIISERNGLLAFVLVNAAGTLQDSVPEDIAHDSTKATLNAQSLEPGLSCLACHGPHDGWIPAPNQVQLAVKAILPGGQRVDVFGDLKGRDPTGVQTLQTLAGLYMGDIEPALRIARDAHALATFRVTNGMTVPQVTAEFQRQRDYYAARVNAERALEEVGRTVNDGENPWEVFATTVPALPVNEFGFSPEHPDIATLRIPPQPFGAGTTEYLLNRAEWERVFPDVMIRKVDTNIQQAP